MQPRRCAKYSERSVSRTGSAEKNVERTDYMKKKWLVILLTMAMTAAGLSGCGGTDKKTDETAKTEDTKTEDAKTETTEKTDTPDTDAGSTAQAVEELSDGLTASDEASQAEIGAGTAELPEE